MVQYSAALTEKALRKESPRKAFISSSSLNVRSFYAHRLFCKQKYFTLQCRGWAYKKRRRIIITKLTALYINP